MIKKILISSLIVFGLMSCEKNTEPDNLKDSVLEYFYAGKNHTDSVDLQTFTPYLENKIKDQSLIFDSVFKDTLKIDYNIDSEVDFRFVYEEEYWNTNDTFQYFHQHSFRLDILNTMIDLPITYHYENIEMIYQCEYGQIIDSNITWSNRRSGEFFWREYVGDVSNIRGLWNENYIPFRLTVNNKKKFGWIKIELTTEFPTKLIIKEIGIEK
jgi:hypothetical protein